MGRAVAPVLVALVVLLSATALLSSDVDDSVEVLTSTNFDELTKNGDWFIKFFAPWCPHCKSLAPVFKEGAQKISAVRFAEVDCDKDKSLCSRFEIRGYPSIVFLHGGQRVPYKGPRSVDGFRSFLSRMTGPAVLEVNLRNVAATLDHARNPVAFVMVGSRDAEEKRVFDAVANSLRESGVPFAFSDDSKLIDHYKVACAGTPCVFVLKAGEAPLVFSGSGVDFAEEKLREWVLEEQFELLTELSPGNYERFMNVKKLWVLLLGNTDVSGHDVMLKELRDAAAKRRSHRDAVFLYINAPSYAEWTKRRFDLKPDQCPEVVIVDMASDRRCPRQFEVKTSDDILKFIDEVKAGKTPCVPFGNAGGLWGRMSAAFSALSAVVVQHPFVAIGIAALLLVSFKFVWDMCGKMEPPAGAAEPEDEKEEEEPAAAPAEHAEPAAEPAQRAAEPAEPAAEEPLPPTDPRAKKQE